MSDWFKVSLPDGADLREHALAYLRSGGEVEWFAWCVLDPDSRAAWAAAGEALAAERAALAGIASRGREAAAAVMAQADGGAALAHIALEHAMDMAETKVL